MSSEVISLYPKDEEKPILQLVTYNKRGMAEDFEEVQEIIKVTRRHFKKGEFFLQTFSLEDLIIERDYSKTELKTLIALKRRLDFNNRIKGFRQVDLAEEIGTTQPNVSSALKRLLKDEIIYRDGVDYYFSDEYIKYAGDETPRRPRGRPKKSDKLVFVRQTRK